MKYVFSQFRKVYRLNDAMINLKIEKKHLIDKRVLFN